MRGDRRQSIARAHDRKRPETRNPRFDGTETEDGERVAVVSEAFVARFFPAGEPVGSTLEIGGVTPGAPLRYG